MNDEDVKEEAGQAREIISPGPAITAAFIRHVSKILTTRWALSVQANSTMNDVMVMVSCIGWMH